MTYTANTPRGADMTSFPSDCYGVRKGQLLAGNYPGSRFPEEARAKAEAFVEFGVTCFVDLTEEDEGLEPYEQALAGIALEHQLDVTHNRFPIVDVNVPEPGQMTSILAFIRQAMSDGEVVYVHCWGGVGRTGTVVGCSLAEGGVSSEKLLNEIAVLRAKTVNSYKASPETQQQVDFIQNWPA